MCVVRGEGVEGRVSVWCVGRVNVWCVWEGVCVCERVIHVYVCVGGGGGGCV